MWRTATDYFEIAGACVGGKQATMGDRACRGISWRAAWSRRAGARIRKAVRFWERHRWQEHEGCPASEPLGIDGCQVRTEHHKGVDLRSIKQPFCSGPYTGASVALAKFGILLLSYAVDIFISICARTLFAVTTVRRGRQCLPMVKGGALGPDALGLSPSPIEPWSIV